MEYIKVSFLFLVFAFVVSSSAADINSLKDGSVRGDEIPIIGSPGQPIGNGTNTTTTTTVTPPSTVTPTPKPTSTSSTTPQPKPTPTSSTTPQPSPSTPSPSTSPAPPHTSTPAPAEDTWTVTDPNTNEICILMKSKVVLHISYVANATSKQVITSELEVPPHINCNGSCGKNNSSQSLVLEWEQFPKSNNKTSSIKFIFSKPSENHCEYFLSNVTASVFVNFTKDNKTEYQSLNFTYHGKEFVAQTGHSFTCAEPSPIKLSGSNNATGELHLRSLQYEAYRQEKTKNFSSAQDCASGQTPDIVPILVAAALVLLVVLVLAAYVITRRRSQARGYLSM